MTRWRLIFILLLVFGCSREQGGPSLPQSSTQDIINPHIIKPVDIYEAPDTYEQDCYKQVYYYFSQIRKILKSCKALNLNLFFHLKSSLKLSFQKWPPKSTLNDGDRKSNKHYCSFLMDLKLEENLEELV